MYYFERIINQKKILFLLSIIYSIFIFRYSFFNLDYTFLFGDVQFSFEPREDFKKYLYGYEGKTILKEAQIKYIFLFFYKYLSFLMHEYLNLSLALINRIQLILCSSIFIFSLHLFLAFQLKNIKPVIIMFILFFIVPMGNILQVVDPIGIWLPASGLFFFYYYFEKDLLNEEYKNILICGFFSALIIMQPRYLLFLIYFVPIYSLLLIKKIDKFKIKYLFKYFTILSLVIFIINFITFSNIYENIISNKFSNEWGTDLKSTRTSFLNQYNFLNSGFIYLVRFFLNTENFTSFLFNEYLGMQIYYKFLFIPYISFLYYFFLKFKNFNDVKNFYIFLIFIIINLFFTLQPLQNYYLKIPGFWTLSSPVHFSYIFLPFICYLFLKGLNNIFSSCKKKILKIIFIVILIKTLVLVSIPNFIKTDQLSYILGNKKNSRLFHNVFEKGWSIIPKEYYILNKILNLDSNKISVISSILTTTIYVKYQFSTLRLPKLLSLYPNINLIHNKDFFINNHVFSLENLYFKNSKKLYKYFKDEKIDYIFFDFNEELEDQFVLDSNVILLTNFLNSKYYTSFYKSNNFQIYKLK